MESEAATNSSLSEKFNKASKYFASVASETDPKDLLEFYSLFKQSTVGPCNISKPGFFDFNGKLKWEAWTALKDLPTNDAMQRYVNKLTVLHSDWEQEAALMKSGWVSVSRMQPEKDMNEDDKTVLNYVQENNLEKIKLFTDEELQQCGENSMGALHWACDRGHLEMIEYLISMKLDINKQDLDGQTPLHYAASCGHESAVNLLLKYGADKSIKDCDDCFPFQVAFNKTIEKVLQI